MRSRTAVVVALGLMLAAMPLMSAAARTVDEETYAPDNVTDVIVTSVDTGPLKGATQHPPLPSDLPTLPSNVQELLCALVNPCTVPPIDPPTGIPEIPTVPRNPVCFAGMCWVPGTVPDVPGGPTLPPVLDLLPDEPVCVPSRNICMTWDPEHPVAVPDDVVPPPPPPPTIPDVTKDPCQAVMNCMWWKELPGVPIPIDADDSGLQAACDALATACTAAAALAMGACFKAHGTINFFPDMDIHACAEVGEAAFMGGVRGILVGDVEGVASVRELKGDPKHNEDKTSCQAVLLNVASCLALAQLVVPEEQCIYAAAGGTAIHQAADIFAGVHAYSPSCNDAAALLNTASVPLDVRYLPLAEVPEEVRVQLVSGLTDSILGQFDNHTASWPEGEAIQALKAAMRANLIQGLEGADLTVGVWSADG